MSGPALVRWGSASAWFSDARDADALASVLRRGPDTVTVDDVPWGPDECDDAMKRRDELEEAIDAGRAPLRVRLGSDLRLALLTCVIEPSGYVGPESRARLDASRLTARERGRPNLSKVHSSPVAHRAREGGAL